MKRGRGTKRKDGEQERVESLVNKALCQIPVVYPIPFTEITIVDFIIHSIRVYYVVLSSFLPSFLPSFLLSSVFSSGTRRQKNVNPSVLGLNGKFLNWLQIFEFFFLKNFKRIFHLKKRLLRAIYGGILREIAGIGGKDIIVKHNC